MKDADPPAHTLSALYAAVAAVLDGDAKDPLARSLLDDALAACPVGEVVATAVVSVAEEFAACCAMLAIPAATVVAGVAEDRSAQSGPGPQSALLWLASRYLDGGLGSLELAIPALCEAHPGGRLRYACVDLLAGVYTWGARVRGTDPLGRVRALCLTVAN